MELLAKPKINLDYILPQLLPASQPNSHGWPPATSTAHEPRSYGAGRGQRLVTHGPDPANFHTVAPIIPSSTSCPIGLEYLTTVDQLLIEQKIELMQVFFEFETNNKYELRNTVGQQLYFAAEQNDCCASQCCGSARAFSITITDIYSRVVIEAKRPLRCKSCCLPCCLQQLEVFAPQGHLIGTVEQNCSFCYPNFTVYNDSHEAILKIEGPCNQTQCCCCGDIKFRVLSLHEKREVGCIRKEWSGIVREAFTNADHFSVSFPLDMDVKVKAILVATAFLIDFMFFEETKSSISNVFDDD